MIVSGLLLLVRGEADFDTTGFVLVMSASCMSGLRFTLTQVLLHGNRGSSSSSSQQEAGGAGKGPAGDSHGGCSRGRGAVAAGAASSGGVCACMLLLLLSADWWCTWGFTAEPAADVVAC